MDRFAPVAFDPKAHAAEKRNESTAFRQAYDALERRVRRTVLFAASPKGSRNDAG